MRKWKGGLRIAKSKEEREKERAEMDSWRYYKSGAAEMEEEKTREAKEEEQEEKILNPFDFKRAKQEKVVEEEESKRLQNFKIDINALMKSSMEREERQRQKMKEVMEQKKKEKEKQEKSKPSVSSFIDKLTSPQSNSKPMGTVKENDRSILFSILDEIKAKSQGREKNKAKEEIKANSHIPEELEIDNVLPSSQKQQQQDKKNVEKEETDVEAQPNAENSEEMKKVAKSFREMF